MVKKSPTELTVEEKLQALYDVGVRDAQAKIEQIRRFLADTGMKK